MPRPYRTVVTGAGVSVPWNPDYYRPSPFNIGIGVTVNSSAVSYSVEHSFDPLFQNVFASSVAVIPASAATWFPNSGITAQTTNKDGNYAFPVIGIRLNVSAGSSTGTVTATFLQAGV